ncbi:MAG: tetratricopeptide repeat protein [Elusimicrobia bacterium]|nr:tetratricopeptide repeat protein [Elusimicrobiota bacterium]
MTRNILKAAVLVLLLGPARAWAGGPTGGSELFNFLFLDANARPVALGGAYTALASESNALLYNPGGLGLVESHEATFMHSQYLDEGLGQEYFSAVLRQGLGVSVNYLGFGKTSRTTYGVPDGTGLGDFDLTDLAVSAGYGRRLAWGLSGGLAYKFIRETADTSSADGHAADLGLLFESGLYPGLRLGAALQNLGPSVSYGGTSSELPLNVRWGASYAFTYAGLRNVLSVDGLKSRGDRFRAAAGVEVLAAGTLALRLGFNGRVDAGPGVTAGLGLRLAGLMADYAFVPYGSLGNAHRASVTWRWGPKREPPMPVHQASEAPESAPPAEEGVPAEERFARAEALMEEGKFDEARLELYAAGRAMGENDRRRVLFHERLGHAAFVERDFPKARASYSEALRAASRLGVTGGAVADAYAGMGLCLSEEGNGAYGRKFLLKALDAGPSRKTRARVQDELRRIEERE